MGVYCAFNFEVYTVNDHPCSIRPLLNGKWGGALKPGDRLELVLFRPGEKPRYIAGASGIPEGPG